MCFFVRPLHVVFIYAGISVRIQICDFTDINRLRNSTIAQTIVVIIYNNNRCLTKIYYSVLFKEDTNS